MRSFPGRSAFGTNRQRYHHWRGHGSNRGGGSQRCDRSEKHGDRSGLPSVSTGTGNYTVTQLPIGSYELSATVQGFKRYERQNLTLAAAQVLRLDIPLEIGASTEAVTVSAESSLLKTETGDVAHNITLQQLQNLPILGIGGANAGSSGVRNPFNSTVMIPGVDYAANFVMIVNGAPSNTASYRVEGLDNTNHTVSFALQENQPSPDAIQEVAVQTSNYAAEYGQAGGGLFNITMKSGTNQFHGSGYEYFVNEDLNAASSVHQRRIWKQDPSAQPPQRLRRDHRRPDLDSQGLRRSQPDLLLFQLGRVPRILGSSTSAIRFLRRPTAPAISRRFRPTAANFNPAWAWSVPRSERTPWDAACTPMKFSIPGAAPRLPMGRGCRSVPGQHHSGNSI